MTPKPPPMTPMTADWDLEDEGAGATREMEADELFLRAGLAPSRRATPGGVAPARPQRPEPPTIPPPMPPEEYVEEMMRMAPPSDAGLIGLGVDLSDGFDALTPWAATSPLPSGAVSSASAPVGLRSAELDEARGVERTPTSEDLGAAGSASYREIDFSDLLPEVSPRRRAATPPSRSAADDLDALLNEEALKVARKRSDTPPPKARSSAGRRTEVAFDGGFDDPALLPPSSQAGDAMPPVSFAEADENDPSMLGIEDRTVTELPDSVLLGLRDRSDEVMEPVPDTMVEAVRPRAPLPPPDADEGTLDARLARLRARFEVGDFSGALIIAEGMLDEAPRHLAARCYADSCRAMLREMYQQRIGDRAGLLRVIMPTEQLKYLALDHRAGFLLSCIDGRSSIDDVLDVSGMQPLDALRMLYELIQEGAIEVQPPPPKKKA